MLTLNNKITINKLKLLLTNIIKYTLATTIVDECNSDDTGVGLSIATGNQYWNKYNELLHIIATTTNNIITSLPLKRNIKNTKSPHRLYIIADIAPLFALGRIQYLIKHIDIILILSHLINITILYDINIKIINLTNINFNNLKLSFDTSFPI